MVAVIQANALSTLISNPASSGSASLISASDALTRQPQEKPDLSRYIPAIKLKSKVTFRFSIGKS